MMLRIKTGYLLLLFVLVTALFSCTPRKKQIYLGKGSAGGDAGTTISNTYKLGPGDMLYIKVQTLDEKTYRLFNSQWMSGGTISEMHFFIDSYTISDSGTVNMPVAGAIQLTGLTLDAARSLIQSTIDAYLLEAVVSVKLINFKISVLGEVLRPGTFKIYDNSVNILEALSMAGDMNVFGNRERIMVLRKSDNNKTAFLDLTDLNCINSEFFYLMPDDVVYVEPTVAKSFGFKEFPWSILFSGITTVIVLINFLDK